MRSLTAGLFVAFAVATPAGAAQSCPPPGWDRAALEQLQTAKFEIADPAKREIFAESIVACTASLDPFLRDSIAFEALSHMLRGEQLDTPVRLRIARNLLHRLTSQEATGVEAPFAALILSEIVRADRIKGYLPAATRNDLAEAAIAFLSNVTDYRGFDERDGWRHRVAHGADLAMQIARNPNFADRAQLLRLRDAIGKQIAPRGHFYVYGEPDRLMQAILALAQRNVLTQTEWTQWFAVVSNPAPYATWFDTFKSQDGLAKLHNTRAFLYAVWINARLDTNADDDVLLDGAHAALKIIP